MAINSSFDISRLRSCEKEPETVAWMEKNLDSNSIFFDIGANVGAYSLIGGLTGASVYAIEPSPSTFATLSENIRLNARPDLHIVPIQCLLGDTDSVEQLHFSSTESGAAEHAFTEGRAAQSIPMFRVDTLCTTLQLPLPTHLKIDVDGTEMSILKSIPFEKAVSILIETENDEVQAFLESKGFVLSEKFARKKPGPHNYVYKRR